MVWPGEGLLPLGLQEGQNHLEAAFQASQARQWVRLLQASNWLPSLTMKGILHLSTAKKVTSSFTEPKPKDIGKPKRKHPLHQRSPSWHLCFSFQVLLEEFRHIFHETRACLGAFRLWLCQRSVWPLYFEVRALGGEQRGNQNGNLFFKHTQSFPAPIWKKLKKPVPASSCRQEAR